MNKTKISYTFVDTIRQLKDFYTENKSITWLSFDTEFISEKRFRPQLCLLQVATENGIYIIDCIALKDLSLFNQFLTDPAVLKITHAGENDYRIFKTNFDVLPVNVFDTQLAMGFLSYNYPLSFKDLVGKKLNIRIEKGFKVSNWEKRPIDQRQLAYAVDDVLYLHELYLTIREDLEKMGRWDWAVEECKKLCTAEFYETSPFKDLTKSKTFLTMKTKNKVFFIRLILWRMKVAAEKNYSKNMVLDTKIMYAIIRNISSGKYALTSHRIIPQRIIKKYWKTFLTMYEAHPTLEEMKVIKKYTTPVKTNLKQGLIMDVLTSLLKYKAMDYNIAPNIFISRNDLNQMKSDNNFFPPTLENTWRKEILGEAFISWLKNRTHLKVEMKDQNCILSMN